MMIPKSRRRRGIDGLMQTCNFQRQIRNQDRNIRRGVFRVRHAQGNEPFAFGRGFAKIAGRFFIGNARRFEIAIQHFQ